MIRENKNNLFEKTLVKTAFKEAFIKLNPTTLYKNPVMFAVEIGTAIMLGVCIWILLGEVSQGSFWYNFFCKYVILFNC
ncbi:hypothetical protein [Algoriella sp.]|uniref:hypothetical protein n=1 Tax=Algoriella sp. TaxID=1872434 RepID=UPI002FCC409F